MALRSHMEDRKIMDTVHSATDMRLPDLSALPAGFAWGTATASFQIEGDAGHRGESIWDELCRVPGKIADGQDGSVTCDHVNRYREDIELLRRMGTDAYRFSISWPRVMPGGRGPVSRAGLDFYDRLVDSLLEAGIQPWTTIYHWDLPLELQKEGGWASRDVVDPFVEYGLAVHAALGDRVRHWTTINEPWCCAWLGHGNGHHAPGIRDHAQGSRAAHHLQLAHGRLTRALRAQAPADHQIGLVLNICPVYAEPGAPESVVEVARVIDGFRNRWWLDSVFAGRYPQDVLDVLAPHLDGVIQDGDLAEISAPLDYLGINYYSDQMFTAPSGSGDIRHEPHPVPGECAVVDPGPDATQMGWPVTPGGLREILLRVGREYPNAPHLVVTENGAAYPDDDPVGADGRLEDTARMVYLQRHLEALNQAVALGADVRGYFVWSCMDNFEWAFGFTRRFGLIGVDFATQERRPKRSYDYYHDAIAAYREQVRVRGQASS